MEKTIKFLDFMVKAVFVSTFLFTIIIGVVVCMKDWEQVANTLVERWFTIMVGELVVAGLIQIVKEITRMKVGNKERD